MFKLRSFPKCADGLSIIHWSNSNWYRDQIPWKMLLTSCPTYRLSVREMALMSLFYFNFIINVLANICYSINISILLPLIPVKFIVEYLAND